MLTGSGSLARPSTQRFEEDFTDGDLDGWTISYMYPSDTNLFTVDASNGQLRIRANCGPCYDHAAVFYRTNLFLKGFALSIDILGWEEGLAEDRPNILLVARLAPSSVPPAVAYAYAAGPSTRYYLNPYSQSVLWYAEHTGTNSGPLGGFNPFAPRMDPGKDYRLIFRGGAPG